MEFHFDSAVTSLSFFSNLAKAPLLLSAGETGNFCLWDLRARCLRFQQESAHSRGIHSAFFLPGQFQVITAGDDNALRIWGIDEIDGSPRELKSREGHGEGASLVQFYGFHGVVSREGSFDGLALNVLSAGEDRAFRTFHVLRDQLSGELSQGSAGKRVRTSSAGKMRESRLPRITCFAYSEGREKDWANVVTCHEGSPFVWVSPFPR